VVAAIIAALLATICCLLLCRRAPAKPPAVATVADTTWLTESTFTVHYKPDAAASKELAKLRAELDGQRGFVEQLISDLDDMRQESQYLADSISRLMLDSLRGIVRIERGPAGIAVVSYQRGLVQRFSLPVWRQRWTLLAGKEKPTVKNSRLPFDVGLFAAGGFSTPPTAWAPAPFAWAGLSMTRQCLTASVGPYFDGALKLRAALRLDWRL
jgi:hypothetical protein